MTMRTVFKILIAYYWLFERYFQSLDCLVKEIFGLVYLVYIERLVLEFAL